LTQSVSIEEKIAALMAPIVEELGVEVLKVACSGGRNSRLVRVIVDRKGGISSEVLEQISHGLSLQLDVEDPLSGRYRLEVSSPGLDWPLESDADFARYLGDYVSVLLQDGGKLEGKNLGLEGDTIRLQQSVGKGKKAVLQEVTVVRSEVVRVVRAVCWDEVSHRRGSHRRGSHHGSGDSIDNDPFNIAV